MFWIIALDYLHIPKYLLNLVDDVESIDKIQLNQSRDFFREIPFGELLLSAEYKQ